MTDRYVIVIASRSIQRKSRHYADARSRAGDRIRKRSGRSRPRRSSSAPCAASGRTTQRSRSSRLRETGRRYLVGTPKSELRKWAAASADARDWHTVREGVEAKQGVGPDGAETFVLIRSVERREKERAMHEPFARRIEDRLTRLGRRVQHARRPLDVRKLERQVGRLLEQNQRAAARYVIEFLPAATRPASVRLESRPARVGRLGAVERRLLRTAHERAGLESRRANACLQSGR